MQYGISKIQIRNFAGEEGGAIQNILEQVNSYVGNRGILIVPITKESISKT